MPRLICPPQEMLVCGSSGHLQAVLNGGLSRLSSAFIFSGTDVGFRYWTDRSAGRVEMSAEDRAFLEYLLTCALLLDL